MIRLRHYLENEGWWDEEKEVEIVKRMRKEVLQALGEAETKEKAPLSSIFEDVYDNSEELPQSLAAQQEEMLAHLAKYPDHEQYKLH